MCLTLKKDAKPMIAIEDIIVYKQLEQNKFDETDFRTFYKMYPIKLGETYKSEIEIHYREIYGNCVETAIHSIAFKDDAIYDLNEFCPNLPEFDVNYVVVKCIIPKGSIYYKGSYSNMLCYASDTITYTNEIVITFRKR